MSEFPVFDGYAGFREVFTFREEAALTIPKRIRELAYSLQVDIEITSTQGNDYKNFKSDPPFSFYGYAVIVLRDHSQIQIPIEQARQVLYYDRVVEAYANWWSLYLTAFTNAALSAIVANNLDPIAESLGLDILPAESVCASPPAWEELPIREVYVKTRFGTQFKIEVSWFEPVPATYGECEYDGSSQFTDSPKDGGLPPEGTQPQSAPDPNNPYDGFDPPTSAEELGDFFNLKQSNLDLPNPNNAPIEPTYWTRFTGVFLLASRNCEPVTFFRDFQLRYADDRIAVNIATFAPNPCGGIAGLTGNFRSVDDGYIYDSSPPFGNGQFDVEIRESFNGQNPFL